LHIQKRGYKTMENQDINGIKVTFKQSLDVSFRSYCEAVRKLTKVPSIVPNQGGQIFQSTDQGCIRVYKKNGANVTFVEVEIKNPHDYQVTKMPKWAYDLIASYADFCERLGVKPEMFTISYVISAQYP